MAVAWHSSLRHLNTLFSLLLTHIPRYRDTMIIRQGYVLQARYLPRPRNILQSSLYISICITSLLALSMPARIWDYG